MRKLPLLFISIITGLTALAGRISGTVTDDKGQLLAYASILVKGTTLGTIANKDGHYFLQLEAGTYTIVAQYVGYSRQEKNITIGATDVTCNFQLSIQQLTLKEVTVMPGAGDPAYEIIRQAIKKRPYYLNQTDRFQCEVYIKGQLQLRDYPKKILGEKVDFDDGDTSKQKMLYLSETLARYTVQKPSKSKIEVLSTRVSGQRDAFGLSTPHILSFYENNIQIDGLNPRGFVSPIAGGALHFYRYTYEGSFVEDGREINRIRVIPKRRYEPLFSGYIHITEGDWRIHSLNLQLTKASQMEILDTLNIEQLYVPLNNDVWVIKTQVIYPAVKIFGFDAFGSFVNIYSKFDIDPPLAPKYFNNTFLKVYDGSNKKPADYWDSIRPVPLQAEELAGYHKKDSLERAHKDPRYLDSMDRRRNKPRPLGLILTGQSFSREKKRESFYINPILKSVAYNTVEGWSGTLGGRYTKRLDTLTHSRRSIRIEPAVRYAFNNRHLNASGSFMYTAGEKYFSSFSVSGGKWIYQFNNANPITQLSNTIRTWLFERNYAKFYEALFGSIHYTRAVGAGVYLSGDLKYEDRIPLENTSWYSFGNRKNVEFTPNYPEEIMTENFQRHQALIARLGISWQPGTQYIEYPDRMVNAGSNWPLFTFNYYQGLHNLLGSYIDFSKWRFDITDDLNMKLLGNFRYRVATGGFFNADSVAVIDYTHFNGNQILAAAEYLNGFQVLPYYRYSNKERWYVQAHIEHHFKGLLTNKIPLFQKLNWYLVSGANAFYINNNQKYLEVFGGLDNILKILRVDFVYGFEDGLAPRRGLRMSFHSFGRY
jgi:hypothetical protein